MKVEAYVLRLDIIHPLISGNKWFKLKNFISTALENGRNGLLSFGGAYSNHLVAMAWACKEHGLQAYAFVRGEDDENNYSVQQMRAAGMELEFVSREAYRNKEKLIAQFDPSRKNFNVVPEGGLSEEGITGASEIISSITNNYTHIVCAAGTGTTLAGIARASLHNQTVIGIPVIKLRNEHENDLVKILAANARFNNYELHSNFHFGGYAKRTNQLIDFMNHFYKSEQIPTDFVYTAKMFFAAEHLIANGYFPAGSRILLIHTGGLQGNNSLPPDSLVF